MCSGSQCVHQATIAELRRKLDLQQKKITKLEKQLETVLSKCAMASSRNLLHVCSAHIHWVCSLFFQYYWRWARPRAALRSAPPWRRLRDSRIFRLLHSARSPCCFFALDWRLMLVRSRFWVCVTFYHNTRLKIAYTSSRREWKCGLGSRSCAEREESELGISFCIEQSFERRKQPDASNRQQRKYKTKTNSRPSGLSALAEGVTIPSNHM